MLSLRVLRQARKYAYCTALCVVQELFSCGTAKMFNTMCRISSHGICDAIRELDTLVHEDWCMGCAELARAGQHGFSNS